MNKDHIFLLLITVVFILLTERIFPQSINDGFRSTLSIGAAVPSGDFGATSGEKGGYATTGFAASLDLTKGLDNNLAWVTSGIIAINSIDEAALKEDAEVSVDAGMYMTSWLLTGFGMEAAASPTANLFFNGQLGVFYSNFPDITYAGSINQTTTSSPAFGFAINAGVKFEKIRFTFRYLSGEPNYEMKASNGSVTIKNEQKLPVGLILLQIGLNL